MSGILLYLDEDAIDEDFIKALRSQDLNILTVADVGMLHRFDAAQLA